MDIRTFLAEHQISVGELAAGIGLERSTAGNKIYGLRPWLAEEAGRAVAFLRERTGKPVTFEQLFGEPALPAAANS